MVIDLLASMAIIIPAFLLALSFHEFSHALVATLLGDTMARRAGRLTLNPMAHIDPLGLLFLIVFRIGWARPVPFDPTNFKRPRIDAVLTAFAGPLSNLILAILGLFALKYLPVGLMTKVVAMTLVQMLKALVYINVMLGVFNMLPLPPLDGSHLLHALLMAKFPRFVFWIWRYSLFILLLIFMLPFTRFALIKLIMTVHDWLHALIL